ncbi:hypothetical protein GCM10010404_72460 [Nonomuraea africana]
MTSPHRALAKSVLEVGRQMGTMVMPRARAPVSARRAPWRIGADHLGGAKLYLPAGQGLGRARAGLGRRGLVVTAMMSAGGGPLALPLVRDSVVWRGEDLDAGP